MSLPGDRGQDPRRRFLQMMTGMLGGLVGAVATLPGLALLLHPLRRQTVRGGKEPVRVAALRQLTPLLPMRVDIRGELQDAWSRVPAVKLGSCWLVRTDRAGLGSASGDRAEVRAFSTVCPHLGCAVELDESRQQFVCPCHQSMFSLEGKTLSGPSPRSLDELPVALEGEDVKVAYRRYRTGVPGKEEV